MTTIAIISPGYATTCLAEIAMSCCCSACHIQFRIEGEKVIHCNGRCCSFCEYCSSNIPKRINIQVHRHQCAREVANLRPDSRFSNSDGSSKDK